jgi:hypothetical protein
MLNEAWEVARKGLIEFFRIDMARKFFYDRSAAAWRVALFAVEVLLIASTQDAGTMQEIVHQTVDRNHFDAGGKPARRVRSAAHQ